MRRLAVLHADLLTEIPGMQSAVASVSDRGFDFLNQMMKKGQVIVRVGPKTQGTLSHDQGFPSVLTSTKYGWRCWNAR